MESSERNKRVVELLTRKDAIDGEIAAHDVKPAPAPTSERKQITCSICKEQGLDGKGHNKKGHAAWVARNQGGANG